MDVFRCMFVFSMGNERVVLVPMRAMIYREVIKWETEVKWPKTFFLLFQVT
jgi:hypothetical protein